MTPRALSWMLVATCLLPGVLAADPPPFYAAEGEATFTLIAQGKACATPATAAFLWENTALPDDPQENLFQAVGIPAIGCMTGSASEGFREGACERYQTVGIRCVRIAADTASLVIADDGTFHFMEEYDNLGDIVYVNGTMGGIMPCAGANGSYLYAPCPGTATRGLPDL